VTFVPVASGEQQREIHIADNDADEKPLRHHAHGGAMTHRSLVSGSPVIAEATGAGGAAAHSA